MTDTNSTRARHAELKQAFTEVLGDPYASPEIDGWYNTFKRRSTVGAQRCNFDEGHGTMNAARPSTHDFFCDVEMIVQQIVEKNQLTKFVNTYIVGDIESSDILTQTQRNYLEQRIGRLFIAYNIVPVGDYFKTLRRGAPNATLRTEVEAEREDAGN